MFHKEPITKKFSFIDSCRCIGLETDDPDFSWNDLRSFVGDLWLMLKGEKE